MQGTSGKKDPRYAFLLNIDELIDELDSLNKRNVPFMLSFDGTCGDKSYGSELPEFLGLKKVLLNAGRSSQATLLGRKEKCYKILWML
jgi:DNA adenine methylase